MDDCFKRVKNFIRRPFALFLFLNIQVFLPSREKGKWCLAAQGLGVLPGGSVSVPSACSLAPGFLHCGIRHCVFYKKALPAGWWTMRWPSQGLQS